MHGKVGRCFFPATEYHHEKYLLFRYSFDNPISTEYDFWYYEINYSNQIIL